ncbi:hypothetical protein L3Q82_010789 [Scortum barcoo]|uniref:Uncharacterized protein n=1 Tax=Scortum barcoo TaxID=214431 RepID=A0ACB8W9T3_9TELE|nr:hypothetical protein L3Q82_010789 [Scortum barcoo]
MDPAGLDSVKTALSAQDQKIQLHEIQLTNISSGIKELMDSHAELKTGVDTQVRHLTVQLQQIINQLEEITASRAKPAVSLAAAQLTTSAAQQEASRALLRLKQENRRVVDCAVEFRTLAADSGWNSAAIKDAFVNGLNDRIKNQLASHEPPEEFEDLVDLATRIDVRLQERESERRRSGSSSGFTKLDLRNTYHLVRIRERDEWKTGFNTPTGHYVYLVMPFGLTAVFQGFINEILHEYLNDFVFVYLDDILIFSPDPDTHQCHARQVLLRLLKNQLYVKAEKCEFHASSVSFLGFIISENQVKMHPEKVSTVTNWPALTTRKKVQQFLGFANFYRKFIRNFSTVAGSPACTNLSQSSFSVGSPS